MAEAKGVNLWSTPAHALDYLSRADSIPHRVEGEACLLDCLPPAPRRILDIGAGAGRLISLVKKARSDVHFVALDFSDTMLGELRKSFPGDASVEIVAHDFDLPLPAMQAFDAVISSFAIHHVAHERKRALYGEIFDRLVPGGVFLNLEHVSSPTPRLHDDFLRAIGWPDEDPSNKLLDLETQLRWLREIGFIDVDCVWKWRELALLSGAKPVR
jgi:tRNA (cmo5U34)-methyltransferase